MYEGQRQTMCQQKKSTIAAGRDPRLLTRQKGEKKKNHVGEKGNSRPKKGGPSKNSATDEVEKMTESGSSDKLQRGPSGPRKGRKNLLPPCEKGEHSTNTKGEKVNGKKRR